MMGAADPRAVLRARAGASEARAKGPRAPQHDEERREQLRMTRAVTGPENQASTFASPSSEAAALAASKDGAGGRCWTGGASFEARAIERASTSGDEGGDLPRQQSKQICITVILRRLAQS